jgi:hypothetical protein
MPSNDIYEMKSDFNIRFFYGNTVCCGTASNLSVEGMFIHTKTCYPVDSIFDVLFLVDGKILKIPVKVKGLLKTDDFYNAMAVEILSLQRNYLDLIDSVAPADTRIKSTHKAREKVFA